MPQWIWFTLWFLSFLVMYKESCAYVLMTTMVMTILKTVIIAVENTCTDNSSLSIKTQSFAKEKKQHQAVAWVAHMSQIILNDASENWIFLLCDDQYKVQLQQFGLIYSTLLAVYRHSLRLTRQCDSFILPYATSIHAYFSKRFLLCYHKCHLEYHNWAKMFCFKSKFPES